MHACGHELASRVLIRSMRPHPHQAQHDSAYMLVHRISLGIACASLAVRRDCIVVARTDGRIALYGLVRCREVFLRGISCVVAH